MPVLQGPRPENYVALSLPTLTMERPLACDLYIQEKSQFVLYRTESIPFTMGDCERLLSTGVSNLWIRVPLAEKKQKNLNVLLSLPDDQMLPKAKAGLLYGTSKLIIEQVTERLLAQDQRATTEVNELVGTTISYLSSSQSAFPALLAMMRHDFWVYSHALNVTVYALALAKYLGTTDSRELRDLGLGAILHDLGKMKIPQEILDKVGPLSEEEWGIIRKHPGFAFDALRTMPGLPAVSLTVIRQHHERIDGSGYPDGIAGENLHPFSRIVALVDAYDAMTGHRPYREPSTPFHALSVLKKDTVLKLDPALFAQLVRLLGNPGSLPLG